MGNGEHRFYCGDIATADDGDLVMKMNNTRIDIYKPLYLNDTLFQQGGGSVNPFNEDVIIADTYKLKTDTITTNGFNDLVFNIDTLGEFLRFNSTNFKIEVPNNRLLIAKNFFSDIIKPLSIVDDISIQGRNDAEDNHEEYMKINSTNKSIDFSKKIDASENIVMKPNKFLYFDETGDKIRYITSTERSSPSVQNHLDIVNMNSSQGRIRLLIGNTGSDEQFLVDNNIISCKRNLRAGAGLETNTINTVGNADLVIKRNGTEFLKLVSTANAIEVADTSRILTPRIYTDLIACNTLGTDTVFYGSNTAESQAVEYFRFNYTNESVDFVKPIRSNTINSNGNNAVNLQQNGNTFIALQGSANRVQVNKLLRVVDSGNSIQAHFVQSSSGNYMSFTLGNHIGTYVSGGANSNTLHLNYYSHGNVMLGTNQDTSPDNPPTISINKFSSDTGKAFEVAGDSLFSGTVSTDTIDTATDTDLVINRNGTEILRFRASDSLILGSDNSKFSTTKVYSNEFLNRTLTYDTVFYGANSAGDNRVEYMRWNRTEQSLDFNAPIDNTGIAVIGNIVDTTVSDERLKTNIKDVECNFTECVKNVKVKTFEYTNEKYKNNDKYGFIAQELQKHLPKEFNHIVQENKDKKSDDKYLSINYMKVNLLLWGALQEEIDKREHIESRLFELEDIVKELKGKKTTKPKAKAKSKTKVEK